MLTIVQYFYPEEQIYLRANHEPIFGPFLPDGIKDLFTDNFENCGRYDLLRELQWGAEVIKFRWTDNLCYSVALCAAESGSIECMQYLITTSYWQHGEGFDFVRASLWKKQRIIYQMIAADIADAPRKIRVGEWIRRKVGLMATMLNEPENTELVAQLFREGDKMDQRYYQISEQQRKKQTSQTLRDKFARVSSYLMDNGFALS